MHLKFNKKKGQRKAANAKRKAYLLTLGSFITMFFILCISPVFSGATYRFPELKLGDYQTLSPTVKISVAKKEYNPANQTLRIDYQLKSENDTQILSNMKYKIENKYIKQKQDDVKTKVYRASDDYIIVISKNIPEDFGVVSSMVKPEYIHPELQTDAEDIKDSSFKTYIVEKDKLKNNSLKEESKDFYEKEYLTLLQKDSEKEIKDLEQKIRDKNSANKQLEIKNDKLKKEMEYQTEAEKAKTQNMINSNTATVNNNNKEIELIKNDIKMKHEKIKLLNEKKKTI
ncbi:hypothetical protein [Bacillus cereus]|uniref:hypothetical protein n=1 Tax=Bacillus cereus group TaxID=86661 RepID=UPI000BF77576|nr:hypothetical protein [Bacillus cereus]MDA1786107.1 hypothetical protein [Bacillus cereus]MDZ4539666.1 hypothetical protein [Bacillus cereus]PER63794.1 hypothetical protein CN502_24500 [Bacillus cereus]PFB14085.1 hypothetical protein CN408_27835 [Bacillus cereus]PFC60845.1 hypothetical protein CN266_25120 [Bacillus cereus]